mgnify:CR=1 FL=1
MKTWLSTDSLLHNNAPPFYCCQKQRKSLSFLLEQKNNRAITTTADLNHYNMAINKKGDIFRATYSALRKLFGVRDSWGYYSCVIGYTKSDS